MGTNSFPSNFECERLSAYRGNALARSISLRAIESRAIWNLNLNNQKIAERWESECGAVSLKNVFCLLSLFDENFLPHSRISPSSTQGDLNNSTMPCIEFKFSNNNSSVLTSYLSFGTKYPINDESADSLVSTTAPLQTTLVSVKAN